MDALREWIWSDLDVIMVGPCLLCGNGYGLIWTLSCMDALRERTGSDLDVIMVVPGMLGTWKTTAGATFSA